MSEEVPARRGKFRAALDQATDPHPATQVVRHVAVAAKSFWKAGAAAGIGAAGTATGHTEAGLVGAAVVAAGMGLHSVYQAWRASKAIPAAEELRKRLPDDMSPSERLMDEAEDDGYRSAAGMSQADALDFRAGFDDANLLSVLGVRPDMSGWSETRKRAYKKSLTYSAQHGEAYVAAFRNGVIRLLEDRAFGRVPEPPSVGAGPSGSLPSSGGTGGTGPSDVERLREALNALAAETEKTVRDLDAAHDDLKDRTTVADALLGEVGDQHNNVVPHLARAVGAVRAAADVLSLVARDSRDFADGL